VTYKIRELAAAVIFPHNPIAYLHNTRNMVLVFHVVVHQLNAVAVLETPTPPSPPLSLKE
jgi:hypothetical protein